MKNRIGIVLLVSAAWSYFLVPPTLFAQACKDDEMIVGEYKKGITELVATVKKESLADFQKTYHQKSCLSNLTFCLTAVNGLIKCLDKAAQDATATKEDVEACKVKQASYGKLKDKIENDRNALKVADDPKQAKALIEKIDLSN